MINLVIYGEAKAQGRARAFMMKNKRIGFYDPDKSRDWKKEIKYAFMKKYGQIKVIEDAIELDVVFFMQRPKSLPKRVIHHIKKPDLDNLLKAVKDALKGVAYHDDSQIVSINAFKFYCIDGCRPHIQVKINQVCEGIDKGIEQSAGQGRVLLGGMGS